MMHMKSTPLLFRPEMIRALLALIKSQTRRVCKLNASGRVERGGRQWHVDDPNAVLACPYGQTGDLIWARETWALISTEGATVHIARKERMPAGKTLANTDGGLEHFTVDWRIAEWARKHVDCERWKPSIFMPRWASRITLRITGVRVQRLCDISYEDACAEGCQWKAAQPFDESPQLGETFMECSRRLQWPQRSYAQLWESINGIGSWSAAPWVWALTFEVIHRNVDDVLREG